MTLPVYLPNKSTVPFFSVSFLPIYYDHIVLSVNSCDTYSFLLFPLHKCELWCFNYPTSGQSVVPRTRWGISMGLLHNTRKICIWRPWNWSSIRWTWKFIHPSSNYKRARNYRIMYLDITKRTRSTVKRTPDLIPQFLINFVCVQRKGSRSHSSGILTPLCSIRLEIKDFYS